MSKVSVAVLQECLREGVERCSNRGLLKAVSWALEQLIGMQDPDTSNNTIISPFDDEDGSDFDQILGGFNAEITSSPPHKQEDAFLSMPSPTNDFLLFARSLVIAGEFQRCAFLLRRKGLSAANASVMDMLRKGVPVLSNHTQKLDQAADRDQKLLVIRSKQLFFGLFLAGYAEYMAGEKMRDQLIAENGGNNTGTGAGTGAGGNSSDSPNAAAGATSDGSGTTGGRNRNTAATGTGTGTGSSGEIGGVGGVGIGSGVWLQLNSEPQRQAGVKNAYLLELCYRELFPLYQHNLLRCDCEDSSFLLYLFAVVLREAKKTEGSPVDSLLHQMHMQFLQQQQQQQQQSSASSSDAKEDACWLVTPRDLFIQALKAFPWNWSCWLELADCCITDHCSVPEWTQLLPSPTALRAGLIGAPEQRLREESAKLMYGCFLAHVYLEKHSGEQALQVLQSLLPVLRHSLPLYTQVGLAQYSLRRYNDAERSFELLREHDPYRLSGLDTYSNILYVKEKRADLSHLAHSVVKVEKFSTESCCVVGNYYSLKGQHERAVLYFQRALRLNSRYLSAWTLMGHEYMELRNAAAAVQCYRNAVGLSESDYRAWYGLGQTYEMLHLYQYANFYFRKAAYLRPSDARMWSAVGNCQLKLGFRTDAIVSFQRAVECGDREGVATRDLARLCRDEGQLERAAHFYWKFLETRHSSSQNPLNATTVVTGEDSNNNGSTRLLREASFAVPIQDIVVDGETAEPLLFLASHCFAQGRTADAEAYCQRLLGFIGPEGDEARNLLRSIKSSSSSSTEQQQPVNTTATATANTTHTPTAAAGRAGGAAVDTEMTPSQVLGQHYFAMRISSNGGVINSSNSRSSGSRYGVTTRATRAGAGAGTEEKQQDTSSATGSSNIL